MRIGPFAAAAVLAGSLVGVGALSTDATAAPAHFNCTYTSAEPMLSQGDTGDAVRQAQCQLNSVLDRRVTVDGIFGSGTRSATVAFQQCAGLSADGIIGPNTWAQLDRWWINDIDCHK